MSTYDWSKPLFITGSMTGAILSGGIASMSLLAIPALFRAPSDQLLLTEWRALRARGRSYAQPLAVLSASCYFLTAYLTHSDLVPTRTYKLIAAGVTTLSIIPFRFLGMYGANVELMSREERSWDSSGKGDDTMAEKVAHGGEGAPGGGRKRSASTAVAGKIMGKGNDGLAKVDTVDVIRWWGNMNLLRALLPAIGGAIAFDAL